MVVHLNGVGAAVTQEVIEGLGAEETRFSKFIQWVDAYEIAYLKLQAAAKEVVSEEKSRLEMSGNSGQIGGSARSSPRTEIYGTQAEQGAHMLGETTKSAFSKAAESFLTIGRSVVDVSLAKLAGLVYPDSEEEEVGNQIV